MCLDFRGFQVFQGFGSGVRFELGFVLMLWGCWVY